MKQTLGETRSEILDRDMEEVERLINVNKHWKDPFYILIAYKQMPLYGANGEVQVKRAIKAYPIAPPPLMGTIVITYDPKSGSITDWKVNPHDAPIDWEALAPYIKGESNAQIRSNVKASDYRYE